MDKVLQLGHNHLEESTSESGKMINLMDKVSIHLEMEIVGMVHSLKVVQMAMVLIYLMGKLLKIIISTINCMDMRKKTQKFNLNSIYIKVNLERAKKLDMEL